MTHIIPGILDHHLDGTYCQQQYGPGISTVANNVQHVVGGPYCMFWLSTVADNVQHEPITKISWQHPISATNDSVPFAPSLNSNPTLQLIDEHLHRTGMVIEQNDLLYLESHGDNRIFYDSVPIFNNTAKSLNFIAKAAKHWTAYDTFTSTITQQDHSTSMQGALKLFIWTVDDGASQTESDVLYWILWLNQVESDPNHLYGHHNKQLYHHRVYNWFIYGYFYNGLSWLWCIFLQLQMLQVVINNIDLTDCIPTDCYAFWLTFCIRFMASICLLTPFDGEFWLHWLLFVWQHDIYYSFWWSRRKISKHPAFPLLLQQQRIMKTRWINTGNQDMIINNQCQLFWLTQEEIDSNNSTHNPTKVISHLIMMTMMLKKSFITNQV